MTTTKKKSLTTAQVLRKLRPMLPKSFKKITNEVDHYGVWPGYTDGRMTVVVRSVCNFRATEKEKNECHAISVNITSGVLYRVSARSYCPRKDGTFNIEGIAAALAGCGVECDRQDEARKQREKDRISANKKRASMEKETKAALKELGLPHSRLSQFGVTYVGPADDKHSIAVTANEDGIRLDLRSLSVSQMRSILEVALELS